MSLGNLLGLLGLLGIVALVAIYLIRPNYQQKFVSSTFIWQKSLKYRKKRVPVSKLRNIILIILQILILVLAAMLLTQPFIPAEETVQYPEKIVIIDASGSMMASVNDGTEYNTRFDRAVAQVSTLAEDVMKEDGSITVILANDSPFVLVNGVGIEELARVLDSLDSLVDQRDFYLNPVGCSYGEADMDAAIDIAQAALNENPYSEVVLYTGTDYVDKGGINVINVADYDEWNAAVLDVSVYTVENYYSFDVNVACFGEDYDCVVKCTFRGVNENESKFLELTARVWLVDDVVKTVTFPIAPDGADYTIINETQSGVEVDNTETIYSYQSVVVELLRGSDRTIPDDSISVDNTYCVYGGEKPVIKVQYSSAILNSMTASVLGALRSAVSSRWNVTIREDAAVNPATSGYDLYIFEDFVPNSLPKDGAIILFSPNKSNDLGITIGSERTATSAGLTPAGASPLLNFVNPADISITKFRDIEISDGDFETILYYGGNTPQTGYPVLFVKNKGEDQIAVFAFNVNFSLMSMEFYAFVPLMYNLFNYFIPSTFVKYLYEVNDTVALNARYSELTLELADGRVEQLTEFPYDLKATLPGYYSTTEKWLTSERPVTKYFFVKMPSSQSNVVAQEESLKRLDNVVPQKQADESLLVYFAAVMVGLLFVEWWLQNRDKT